MILIYVFNEGKYIWIKGCSYDYVGWGFCKNGFYFFCGDGLFIWIYKYIGEVKRRVIKIIFIEDWNLVIGKCFVLRDCCC